MIGEMIVWGFFSAIGWMGANYAVDKLIPETNSAQPTQIEVKEAQQCQAWKEIINDDGTTTRTRICKQI